MLKIVYKKTDEIIPYENNPRFNDNAVEAVAKSIKEFGFKVPIVIAKDNVIVTGHTRHRSAKLLGLKEVPCVIAEDLTPEQIQAYRIADNKTAEIAEWNYDLLPLEIRELQDADFDLSLLGFDTDELERLLNGTDADAVAGGETEPDAVPDVPEEADSRRGMLYRLGDHLLLCGDSTKPEDIARLTGDDKANLYLVDPPYNVALTGSNGLTIQNDNMADGKFREFLTAAFRCASDSIEPGASFYVFHSDSESSNFRLAARDAGLEVHETLYWVKNSFVLGRFDYHYQSESVLYGWKPGASHSWYSDRCQTNILSFDKPKHNDVHPCLAPDTLVMTVRGYVPIGKMVKGDMVLSHDGKFHPVSLVSRHPYQEDIYRISVTGTNLTDRASHNHPYLVAKRMKDKTFSVAWVDAEKLEVDDFILTPVMKHGNLENVQKLDAWCYGLWLAQGSIQNAGHGGNAYPVFALDGRKKELREKLSAWAGAKNMKVYPNHGNGITVMVFDAEKGKRCVELCGKYASTKMISPEVFSWSRELLRCFYEGYMAGDGCKISTRWHRHAKSVSLALASQMKFIAEGFGYKTGFYFREPSGHPVINGRELNNRLPFYASDYHDTDRTFESRVITCKGNEYWLRRIKSVTAEPYDGDVVNLSVDGGHTFQTAIGMTHNSMKPVEMLVYLVKNSSKRGGTVLDNFGGSGSTLIACEQTGRKCRMIELDEKYCDVIRRRWAEFVHGEGCDWKKLTPAVENQTEGENTNE